MERLVLIRQNCCNRRRQRLRSCAGFSLMELAVALLIITVILISSSALVDNVIEAQRYRKSLEELRRLGTAMAGDPLDLQTGHQATFGYWEAHNTVPMGGDLGRLYELIHEPTGTAATTFQDILQDEWSHNYRLIGGLFYTIRSYGSDGVDNAGANDDLEHKVENDLYRNNRVRIYITDARGMPIRCTHSAETFYLHHIYRLVLSGYGGGGGNSPRAEFVASGPAGVGMGGLGNIVYQDGYFLCTNVFAGFYSIWVTPTPAPNLPWPDNRGQFNHQDDLVGYDDPDGIPSNGDENGETHIRKMIVVYPRGSSIEQKFEVRLPGVLDTEEVGESEVLTFSGNLVVW